MKESSPGLLLPIDGIPDYAQHVSIASVSGKALFCLCRGKATGFAKDGCWYSIQRADFSNTMFAREGSTIMDYPCDSPDYFHRSTLRVIQ